MWIATLFDKSGKEIDSYKDDCYGDASDYCGTMIINDENCYGSSIRWLEDDKQ